jgi:hypothetical protein
MKFTIEVDDFWLDEEELTEALEAHVKRDVVSQISASIKDKVETQIAKKVTETINAKLEVLIDVHLGNLIESNVIIKNSKEIPIAEHIKNLFMNDRGWQSVDDKIRSYSKQFSSEMKLQFDAAFATKVVMNMKEQGLLKNDVVKMLLNEKS